MEIIKENLMKFLRFLRVLLIILAIVAANVGAFCFLSETFYSMVPDTIEQIAGLLNMTAEEFVTSCKELYYLVFFGGAAGCVVLIIIFSIIIKKNNNRSSNSNSNYVSNNYSDNNDGPQPVDLRGPALISTEDIERDYGDYFETIAQNICDTLRSETPSLTYRIFYWLPKNKDNDCRVHFEFRLGPRDRSYKNPKSRSQLIEMVQEGIHMRKYKYSIEVTVDLA